MIFILIVGIIGFMGPICIWLSKESPKAWFSLIGVAIIALSIAYPYLISPQNLKYKATIGSPETVYFNNFEKVGDKVTITDCYVYNLLFDFSPKEVKSLTIGVPEGAEFKYIPLHDSQYIISEECK